MRESDVRSTKIDSSASAAPGPFRSMFAWLQQPIKMETLVVPGTHRGFRGSYVYCLHHIQLERKLALERVRSNIAMDLHDDLGASLARMAVIGEVMKANVSQNDLESQLMLSDIVETSRRPVDGMSDLVWSIDPRHDQAGDTIYRLREFACTILDAKGIRWQLDAGPGVARIKLSVEQRRHLYLVCKEAIHNTSSWMKMSRAAFSRDRRPSNCNGECKPEADSDQVLRARVGTGTRP